MINIYDIEGNVLMQAEITSSAKRYQEMSKSDYISLSWVSVEKVILPVGAYIIYTYKVDSVREVTRQFLLLEAYEPTQSDEMSWKYTPEFQHPMMQLSKMPFYIKTKNSQNEDVKQHIWSFVGTMRTIAGKIEDFLNNEIIFGQAGWVVQYDASNANTINVSFSENDFISALTSVVNAIGDNCEWHIDYDNEVVYIGKIQRDDLPSVTLKVGENVGVPSISNSKESYYNNFAIFGGTRNITQVNNRGENISLSDIRLQLSEGSGTIEIDGKDVAYTIDEYSILDLRKSKNEPIFTKVLDFSQIFPSLNTYVYNVRGREKYVLDENNEKIPLVYNSDGSVATYKTFTVWYMRLAYPTTEEVADKKLINTTIDDGVTHYWYDFEITDSLLVNGKNIGCSFEANFNKDALSTPLAGCGSNGNYVGFELTYHRNASSSHSSDDVSDKDFAVLAGDYEIVYQEDNDLIIPTNVAEMIVPKGETLPSLKCNITVLYNIAMADSIYIKDAQQRLLDAAIKEIQRLRSDLNNYTIKSYPQVFAEQNPCLQIGQKVTYDDGHGYTLSTRVLKLSTNIDYNFIEEITVGDQAIKGTITQLKDDVQSIIASGGNGSGGGSYTDAQLRNLIARYGTSYFLSKQFDDTAQGVITFAKGLVSEILAQLKGGATFGSGGYKFDKDGNLVVDAVSSQAFDEALQRGFGMTRNTQGKYTLSVTDLMVWGKAVFNSLEIRKLYAVGGNVYLSGASSKIQHVVPMNGADGNVTGWKCYILNDDGTTATQNGWAKYDQAKCQTFDIKEGVYENVSNTYYWRLVTDVSTENEAITEIYTDADGKEQTVELYDGKKFGWVVLSKTDCESSTNDEPKMGDNIVLDGHRMFASGDSEGRDQYNDESRTNVMMLETTGVSDGSLPRIVALTGITDYKHSEISNQYSNTVFILSPKEVVFVSSAIKWISASGDPITFVNFRGAWVEGTSYAYYDQVSHDNAIWTCIAERGTTTTLEPTDANSTAWRKEISGGKGDKGDAAVTYGVQMTPYYEWVGSGQQPGLQFKFTKAVGAVVSTYTDVTKVGCTVKVYGDGVYYANVSEWINEGNDNFLYSSFPYNNDTSQPTLADKSVIAVEMYLDGVLVATANLSNGKQGKGALEISVNPDTVVFDTDDDGLVASGTSKTAEITCTRDGVDVTSKCTMYVDSKLNCTTATMSSNVVTIGGVTSQTVSGVTVSNTSGHVRVKVSDPTDGTTHVVTVKFAVNVAKFTGGFAADNKKLKSQYSELTNNGSITSLTEYKSEILQTAREISLTVSEKNVGRRNLLVGSAFRKQGEGCLFMGSVISINTGYEGVNSIRAEDTYTGTTHYYGAFWDGSQGGGSVKITRGKKYTLSAWVKCSDSRAIISLETIYTDGQTGANRGARPKAGTYEFGVDAVNTWQLLKVTIDTSLQADGTSNTQYDYMAVNVFARHTVSGVTVHTYICRPMLEEGDTYNGWTLSEQDYDYVGGNLLDNAGTLTKSGNVETLNGTVTQGGMGESASVKGTLPATTEYVDFLQYSTSGMGLKAGEDYVLSFYAKASSTPMAGKVRCFLYPSTGNINIEDSDAGNENTYQSTDGAIMYGIVPGTAWKRYWVHWSPTVDDPAHVLFRLLPRGEVKGAYSSTTTYAVDEVVTYNSTYWRCVKAGKGNTPSSSSSYWEATTYDVSIAQPKLEVGATMTEWTEKRSDMVDKTALLATGIDIASKKITLTANNTKFQDNDGNELAVIDTEGLRASKIATTDNGSGHTVMSGNTTVWYQKDGKTPGIAVFYDAAGVPHFQFYGTDGSVKYDFGPSGLQSFIEGTQKAYCDTCYIRIAPDGYVTESGGAYTVKYKYVPKDSSSDLHYVFRKQAPTTDDTKDYDKYDGCVLKNKRGWIASSNSYSWPSDADLITDGWYVLSGSERLPIKTTKNETDTSDPTNPTYYQEFYYYVGGKITKALRAYFKLASGYTYSGNWASDSKYTPTGTVIVSADGSMLPSAEDD